MAYWPFVPGQGTRMSKVYSDLLSNDFDLTVITSYTNNIKKRICSVEYNDNGVKIVRIPFLSFRNRNFFWRALNLFSFSLACILAFNHIERKSILFTCGPPEVPYLMLTSSILKLFKSVKHLGLVTDMLPDVAFDLGIIKSGVLRKIITYFCVVSYRKTNHIIVITDLLKERLIEYGIPDSKITIVGLTVDTALFSPDRPRDESISIQIATIKDKFIVLYSGSFGRMYNFEPLLEAAKILKKYDDIHFIIRGGGDQLEYISTKIKELSLSNVSLLGPIPETDKIIAFINAASVCVIPIRRSKNIDMTHPSKLFEFWACQKPVISSSLGETKNLIDKFKGGIAISPDDTQAMINAIIYLHGNMEVAKEMGINGRRLVLNQFSYDKVKKKLIDVILKIGSN